MATRQITVYWSSTWQSCHAAKEFLSSHGIEFTAKNVADDMAARAELIARTGRMAVPVITVDDEVVVGFDRGRLQRLLGIRWRLLSAAPTVARSSSCLKKPGRATWSSARTARAMLYAFARMPGVGPWHSPTESVAPPAMRSWRLLRMWSPETQFGAAGGPTVWRSSTGRSPQKKRKEEDTMNFGALTAGFVAWVGAALASLCCLLPLAVIVLGLGSGAFMATTMQYRWLLVPAGIIGIIAGFALYVRERRRCDALACRMAGSRITLALLILASLVVTTSIVLDRFPEFTSDLLAYVMSSDQAHSGHNMGGMR